MSFEENRVAGTCYVYIDAVPIPLGGTITVGTWTSSKETKIGLSGVVGYSEMPIACFIEVEIFVTPEVDLQAFQQIRNSTVIAEMANGQTYTIRQAWSTTPPEHNGAEGTATLRFESKAKLEKS